MSSLYYGWFMTVMFFFLMFSYVLFNIYLFFSPFPYDCMSCLLLCYIVRKILYTPILFIFFIWKSLTLLKSTEQNTAQKHTYIFIAGYLNPNHIKNSNVCFYENLIFFLICKFYDLYIPVEYLWYALMK